MNIALRFLTWLIGMGQSMSLWPFIQRGLPCAASITDLFIACPGRIISFPFAVLIIIRAGRSRRPPGPGAACDFHFSGRLHGTSTSFLAAFRLREAACPARC